MISIAARAETLIGIKARVGNWTPDRAAQLCAIGP